MFKLYRLCTNFEQQCLRNITILRAVSSFIQLLYYLAGFLVVWNTKVFLGSLYSLRDDAFGSFLDVLAFLFVHITS